MALLLLVEKVLKNIMKKKGYKEIDTFMIKDFWFFEVWFYYLKKKYSNVCILIISSIILIFIVYYLFLEVMTIKEQ